MVRGSGKFKQKRGGGRSFSKNLVLDENGTAVSADRRPRGQGSDDDSNEDSDEEEDEESEEESEEAEAKPELSRAERKALKKKQGDAKLAAAEEEDEDDELINPNHVTKKMNISDLGAPRELSRREREAKEKQDAKDRYWKLHAAGKTDEAKADLNRLAKIRAEREAALAKRKAEAEEKEKEIAAKTAAQRTGKRS